MNTAERGRKLPLHQLLLRMEGGSRLGPVRWVSGLCPSEGLLDLAQLWNFSTGGSGSAQFSMIADPMQGFVPGLWPTLCCHGEVDMETRGQDRRLMLTARNIFPIFLCKILDGMHAYDMQETKWHWLQYLFLGQFNHTEFKGGNPI